MFVRTLILHLLLLSVPLFSDELLYHETLDEDCADLELNIEAIGSNKQYTLQKSLEGDLLSTERILISADGNTLEWFYEDYSEDLVIQASRSGDLIELERQKGRRTKHEEYRIDDTSPWYQLFPFGMEEFITSGDRERNFWFIQPQNLDLSSLRAIRGEEKVSLIHGIREKVTEVEITINNWLSRFWKGFYLLRTDDGRYLFYEGILRRNLSRGTIELVDETE